MAVMGAVERVFAITIQVSLAVLVLQVFMRRNGWWLAAAIGYHTLVDAVTVVGAQLKWSPALIEVPVALFALVSLAIILWLRPRRGDWVPAEPAPALVPGALGVPAPTAAGAGLERERVEDSKYL